MPALLRAMFTQDGNLIELLPRNAYRIKIGNLGYSRRSIVIINDATEIRAILTNPTDIYPKNDLMVGALAPLVGESVFVSDGDQWRSQRAMIAPAFHHMKLSKAFLSMEAAVNDYEQILDARAADNKAFSLDLTMSHLTADVICRTVFSTPLASQTAREVFESFAYFERSVAHVEIKRLIFQPAWSHIPQKPDVLQACERIRSHLGKMVDGHLSEGAAFEDIATEIIAAKDQKTGKGFTREQLIDQLGVFFLAGHETTASALTWAFYVLATRPDILACLREEVDRITDGGPINFSHIRALDLTRSIFKESMRLYPPITFIPRVAAKDSTIMGRKVKRGAMVMIAPWVVHRHEAYWQNPHSFDAERFMAHREHELISNTYMPFGLGPRVCVGANFATIEATLILARLARKYDFTMEPNQTVKPVARLTTRPKDQIKIRVAKRNT
ncbi:MAG: cytochrome P450 [Rhizobiaceae bacterium]|nr:cytochrome P450 [Rhizobiaceae bacterium]